MTEQTIITPWDPKWVCIYKSKFDQKIWQRRIVTQIPSSYLAAVSTNIFLIENKSSTDDDEAKFWQSVETNVYISTIQS